MADRLGMVPARNGQPLVVLHILPSMDCGGLEQVVLDLARVGMERGQQVHVVCLEKPGELAPQLAGHGVELHCLFKPPGIQMNMRRKLRQLFSSLRPTVVHTHHIGALFYAGPPARKTGVPVIVYTDHGEAYGKGLRMLWLSRIAGCYAERYFCVSSEVANEVRNRRMVSSRKVTIVHNGIDTTFFQRRSDDGVLRRELGISSDAPVIGTVGRLAEIKRQDLLVQGFAVAKKAFPLAQLLVVGDGPSLPGLRELASHLEIAESVHFVGYRNDRERYLGIMDVFALTSRSEGMPLSVLEAWAAEVAVITSDVGGLPSLIDHGRNGLLFPSGDTDALADAMHQLLSDRHYTNRLASEGYRDAIAKFDVQTMARRYHDQYNELLDKKDAMWGGR